jgi:hypothetical protein
MEWYEQNPPQQVIPVSVNDYLEFVALNSEPSTFEVYRIYEVNEAINILLHKEPSNEHLLEKLINSSPRKKMIPSGKKKAKKLDKKKASGK